MEPRKSGFCSFEIFMNFLFFLNIKDKILNQNENLFTLKNYKISKKNIFFRIKNN